MLKKIQLKILQGLKLAIYGYRNFEKMKKWDRFIYLSSFVVIILFVSEFFTDTEEEGEKYQAFDENFEKMKSDFFQSRINLEGKDV